MSKDIDRTNADIAAKQSKDLSDGRSVASKHVFVSSSVGNGTLGEADAPNTKVQDSLLKKLNDSGDA